MKNNLQRHERRDSVKWFMVLLAVILLAVSVMAAITQGFHDWNPYGWFDNEQQETPSGGAYDENGNALESGKVYPLSSRMLFSSPSALSETVAEGVTVEATISPATATNKEVTWSVSWVNPQSEWASGKTATDYVTAVSVPEPHDRILARIDCLQPFGEQVKITVASVDTPTATADCTVDYLRRAVSVEGLISYSCEPSDNNMNSLPFKYTDPAHGGTDYLNGSWAFVLRTGAEAYYRCDTLTYTLAEVGTIDEVYSVNVRLTLTNKFAQELDNQGVKYSPTVAMELYRKNLKVDKEGFASAFPWTLEENVFSAATFNKLRAAAEAAYSSSEGNFKLVVDLTGKYSFFTHAFKLYINMSTFAERVDTIEINDSSADRVFW